MPPASSTFKANMLSSKQKRQLNKTGSFKSSKGDIRNASGQTVAPAPAKPGKLQMSPDQVTADQVRANTRASIEADRAAKTSTTLASPIQSPVPATQIQPAPTINLPEPTAMEAATVNNSSIQGAVDSAKNNLTSVLGTQRTEIDKEIDRLTKEQQTALAAGKELTTPFREELEKKQREKLKINENFAANQKLTEELDGLLTQSNELINIATGRQVSGKILNKSLTKTLADVQARAGVIQAVMAARNDQISVAENFIDRTVDAIVADRNDELSYYNTIISMADSKLIKLSDEKYKLAEVARNEAVKDVDEAKATATYIKSLMINPETAQFMADAGVSLTDSIDGVKAKMSKQAKVQEAIDTRNSLVEAGYNISPVPVAGGIAVEAGGQTLYASVRPGSELDLRIKAQEANITQSYAAARASNASAVASETGRLLDLAAAGDPGAISALGLTMPDGNVPSPDLSAFAADYAATGKLPTASSLPKGISVGSIATLAKQLPKPKGAIVSTPTGVPSSTLTADQSKGITAMNEIVNDTLPFMMQKWEEAQRTNLGGTGVVGWISSKVIPSKAMTEYEQARDEYLSKLLVARSGAAVTETEYARYSALVPGAGNTPFGLGASGDTKLRSLDNLMKTNFDNYLNSNQLSVFGYSTIDVPSRDLTVSFNTPYGTQNMQTRSKPSKLTVGEIVENEYGQQGLVLPDGTISLINP
jgi:hypothetical protein